MSEIYFISDTHFSHANILNFKNYDGTLLRGARFANVDEMNEYMIVEWNKIIRPQDKVYHLGDVCFGNSIRQQIVSRLTGKKRLIPGNHDNIKNNELMKHFDKAGIWRIFKEHNFTCSHIPLREDSLREKTEFNVHGHLHQNVVKDQWGNPDVHYINVCVEKTDFRPLHLDEIIALIKRRS
jgi:calcineurin-like phosphoesterase family protein